MKVKIDRIELFPFYTLDKSIGIFEIDIPDKAWKEYLKMTEAIDDFTDVFESIYNDEVKKYVKTK